MAGLIEINADGDRRLCGACERGNREARRAQMATLSTLVNFNGSNGQDPEGLIVDANGDLFGTAYQGGANNDGTVFEIKNVGTVAAPVYASSPTTLVTFDGSNGAIPDAGLTTDANGDLFGTTANGGAYGAGTLFEIANTGTVAAPVYASAPTTLVSFNRTNGANPAAELTADANGDLFGTTSAGGVYNDGTVFEMKNTGTVAAPNYASAPTTTLVSFNSPGGQDPYMSGVIADANGDLFGTTIAGGAYGYGTVFEITNTGTTLITFNGSNGSDPIAGLIADANGDLFGTSDYGGADGYGTVFEMKNTGTVAAPAYASAPTTLVSFNRDNGAYPVAALIADANGDLFGTTYQGGANNYGTAFEIKNTGTVAAPVYATTLTTLVSFMVQGSIAGLIADADGDLFGTTGGGVYGYGSVFEITGSGFSPPPPPPVLTAGGTANYTAGPPVTLDPGLTVSDTESVSLTGATVSISAGFLSGDELSVGSLQAGITSSYNAATGVLTLSGATSLAAYQTELDSVAFACLSTNPSSRTITWSVNAGSTTSIPVNSSVSVRTTKDSGLISGTHATSTTNDEPVDPFEGVEITDPGSNDYNTAILTLNGTGALDATPIAPGVYEIPLPGNSGGITAQQMSNFLDSLTFYPTPGTPGSVTTTEITLTVTDDFGGETDTDNKTIVIDTDPTVAPTISGTHATSTTADASVNPFSGVTTTRTSGRPIR
jgi:uncharacterized repeat protein (TIGR03803 family)